MPRKRSLLERFKIMFSKNGDEEIKGKINVRLIECPEDLVKIRRCQLNTVDFFLLHTGDSVLGQKVFLYTMQKAYSVNPSVSLEQAVAWVAFASHTNAISLIPRGEVFNLFQAHFNRLITVDLNECDNVQVVELHRDVQIRRVCSLLALTNYSSWDEEDRALFVYAILRAYLTVQDYSHDFSNLIREVHSNSSSRKFSESFSPLFVTLSSSKLILLQLIPFLLTATDDFELGLELLVDTLIASTQRSEFCRDKPSANDPKRLYITKLVTIISEIMEDAVSITSLREPIHSTIRQVLQGSPAELCDDSIISSLYKKINM